MPGMVVAALALFVLATISWSAAVAIAPTLLGWKPVVVTSGSMSPRIRPGDVVVAQPVAADRLGPGTVIVFRAPGGTGLVTHRIVEVAADGSYITRGDANPDHDSTPLRPDGVVGVGRLLVPRVGMPALWIRLQAWRSLAVLGSVVVLSLVVTAAAAPSSPVHRRAGRRRERNLRALLAATATGTGLFTAIVAPSTPATAAFTRTTGNSTSFFSASAAPTCSTPGTTVTVAPDADTFVQQDKPNTSFASLATIDVKSAVGKNIRALVHFPLPAPPAGCRVTSAQLSMRTTTFKAGRRIQIVRTAAAWTATGATWNNQPAATGPVTDTASFNGWTVWDVTQQIDDSHRLGNFGLLVRDSAEDDGGSQQNKYSSSEGANPPSLVVTYG